MMLMSWNCFWYVPGRERGREGERDRGRGKTSQRETDIETDAGRLHEHISYIYRNDSRGPSLPRLLLLFVTNGGKASSLSLHRMSPSRFLRPVSLISHSSMLHLQQEQPQNNNKREKKLQMQFVTHKFKKHKNETVAGKTGAQRTRVTCRFSIVRKLIYKTQRCGLAFLRFLRPSTYPPNLHFPPRRIYMLQLRILKMYRFVSRVWNCQEHYF